MAVLEAIQRKIRDGISLWIGAILECIVSIAIAGADHALILVFQNRQARLKVVTKTGRQHTPLRLQGRLNLVGHGYFTRWPVSAHLYSFITSFMIGWMSIISGLSLLLAFCRTRVLSSGH